MTSALGEKEEPARLPELALITTFTGRNRPRQSEGLFALLFRSRPTLGRGALQLPGFTGLHVVPSATQILKNASTLDLLLEHTQRCFDAIAFAEVYFDHSGLPTHLDDVFSREIGRA